MFAEEISRHRKEKGLTQEQLAKLLGRHVKTISNWEQGKIIPDEKTRWELCRVLDIDPTEISADYGSDLFPDEQKIIRIYRRLNGDGKSLLHHLAEVLDSYQTKENKKAALPRLETYHHRLISMRRNEQKDNVDNKE